MKAIMYGLMAAALIVPAAMAEGVKKDRGHGTDHQGAPVSATTLPSHDGTTGMNPAAGPSTGSARNVEQQPNGSSLTRTGGSMGNNANIPGKTEGSNRR